VDQLPQRVRRVASVRRFRHNGREAGTEFLKPAPIDYLQRWPVSKRVNSSKADADDPSLIETVELAAA
jgi:hypothetical protein